MKKKKEKTWGKFVLEELKSGNVKIIQYIGNDKWVEVPQMVDRSWVVRINDQAFSACTTLTDVTIPRSVMSISSSAFGMCNKLTIHAPAGSYAQQYAKKQKSRFQAIYQSNPFLERSVSLKKAPPVSPIANQNIYQVAVLKSGGTNIMRYVGPNSGKVIIPPKIDSNQVEIINTGAFSRCDKLTSVTIPAGVIRIENHAFRGCTNLVETIIPGTVNKIGDNTFEGCQNLTIIAPVGSYAAKHAKKHGIPFRPQPAVPEQGASQPPQPKPVPTPPPKPQPKPVPALPLEPQPRLVPTPPPEPHLKPVPALPPEPQPKPVPALPSEPQLEIVCGDFKVRDHGSGWTVTKYIGTQDDQVEIPEQIKGKPVTRIGFCAFLGCSGLTGIAISPRAFLSLNSVPLRTAPI